jgi:hypothetical protein
MKTILVRLAGLAIAMGLFALTIPNSIKGVALASNPGSFILSAAPSDRLTTVQGVGGVSALLPFTDSGEVIIGPQNLSDLLANPNVDGVSVRLYWRYFYPDQNDPNSINFSALDDLFTKAAAAGKLVRLAVAPGFYSPVWVLKSVPVLMLPVPEGPLSGPPNPSVSPLPVPWNDTYLNDWLAFVDQLAARYGNNPSFSWISVAGPNSHNDEVNLPHYDPAQGQPSSAATWLQAAADAGITDQALQLNWLQQQLEQAYFKCIDRFDAAFGKRGRHYTIALIDRSFPVEGDDTRQQTYRDDLVAYGLMNYPHAFGVQTNGLDARPLCPNTTTYPTWWAYIRDNSALLLTGFQTRAPANLYNDCNGMTKADVLHHAIDNATLYQAHFVEIYSSDIQDPDPLVANEIQYAHQQIKPIIASPLDDPAYFVRQHYLDFLNREPDPPGLAFWINEITSCGSAQSCIDVKRINVSAAFFLSIEFQQTGYLVYGIYKAAYGNISNIPGAPVPVRFNEFSADTREIGQGVIVGQGNWQQQLESNKQAFTSEFVLRTRFSSTYATSLKPVPFVDAMFANAGVTPLSADRAAAINEFGGATTTADAAARSRALRDVAENPALSQQEFSRAFVLMQYFGYLRRNPYDAPEPTLDFQGYNFWLNKLNGFGGNYINAEMVKAFITSSEYRQRFGP